MAVGNELHILLSYLAAFFLAWLVSLDVYGLLLSQRKMFSPNNSFKVSPNRIALLHASVHAGLFFGYYIAVSGLIGAPAFAVRFAKMVWRQLDIDALELSRTAAILSSIVIVIFVWLTYSQKVAEDHSDKLDASSVRSLRPDVRILCGFISRQIDQNFRKMQIAMAFMVGLDMLAITSFIRVFFLSAKDAANIDLAAAATETGAPVHFNFGPLNEKIDFVIFTAIVFTMVYCMCRLAIARGMSLNRFEETDAASSSRRDEAAKRKLLVVRVLEPLLVFICLGMAMDHLFGVEITSPSVFFYKLVYSTILSIVLTGLLVAFNGWNRISGSVYSGYGTDIPAKIGEEWSETHLGIRKFLIGFVAILAGLVFTFYVSHRGTIETGTGLGRFLRYLTIEIGIGSLLILYVPSHKLAALEESWNERFFDQTSSHAKGIAFSILVYACLVAHLHFIRSIGDAVQLRTAESSSGSLLQILYIAGLTFILLYWRVKKLAKAHKTVNLGEWLAAFALAILLNELIHLGL